jgi:hypothetical protein
MKPIVCWDFDETLGYFRPLEYRFLGEPAPAGMPGPRLKPGIRELLATLSEVTHVVTTAAIGEYAREVLREQGLLDCFAAVIGREDGVFTGDGKDYQVAGDRFGIGEKDLCRHLVIVGNDAKKDPDFRYRQIAMIYDDRMVDLPAEPIGIALRRLLIEGERDLRRGFERMLDLARRNSEFNPTLDLDGGVRCRVDYWGSFAENRLHPMIIEPRSTHI